VIDHMAVMRRQIEEMQEKALEGRFIAEDILGKVLADVVAGVEEGAEGFASSNNFARCTEVDNSGFGAASPDYEAPGSPEYIPPQNDMGTEVAETAQRFKCSICGFISEGVIYHLFEHLEEEHGMEDEEEELEKCCIPIRNEQQEEVGPEEEGSAAAKKAGEGPEAQSDTCGETENEVDVGGKMTNAEGNEEKVDLKKQADDQKEEIADLSKKMLDLEEQAGDQEKAEGGDENTEDEDIIAKGERNNTENKEDKYEGDSTQSSSVASSIELQETLMKTGDHKL